MAKTEYPKARIDSLTDGIFSVGMTLLVLDVDLPADFRPADSSQLLRGLVEILPKMVPYALSFAVVGVFWLSNLRLRRGYETVGNNFAWMNIAYLFLITFVPFSTIVLGRYGNLAPAIWLYAGNLALIGFASLALTHLAPKTEDDPGGLRRAQKLGISWFIASTLLTIALSFVTPENAMWGLALNGLAPFAFRLIRARKGADSLL